MARKLRRNTLGDLPGDEPEDGNWMFIRTDRFKGDGEKVKIAERLRCETTMTRAWIAERLGMGTKTHLAHLLYWKKRDKLK